MHTPTPQNGLIVIQSDELQAMMRSLLQEQAANLLQSISDRQPQTPTTDSDKFMTRLEAAKHLRITLPTLNKRMRDGKVQYQRLGRRILIARDSLPQ